jgi:glycosyltransferase 2 family protein
VETFYRAVADFFDLLTSIGWASLALALSLHLLRLGLRCVAWRNIIRAAYPKSRVPLWGVGGAYVAGVGVNSIVPARGGDALKLFLAKQQVRGSTYPTLGATLLPETMLDFALALIIVGWALASGALPGPGDLVPLPTVDWSWPYRHQYVSAIVLSVLIIAAVIALVRHEDRLAGFWARVGQGFAVLEDWRRYLLNVASWQAASWACRFASVVWFLKAFDMPATTRNAFVVLAVQSLATLLPITPGGVGTVQGLLVVAFKGKVAATTVVGFSVGMHVATVAVNVVVGFAAIGIMLRTFRWKRVVRPEKRMAER